MGLRSFPPWCVAVGLVMALGVGVEPATAQGWGSQGISFWTLPGGLEEWRTGDATGLLVRSAWGGESWDVVPTGGGAEVPDGRSDMQYTVTARGPGLAVGYVRGRHDGERVSNRAVLWDGGVAYFLDALVGGGWTFMRAEDIGRDGTILVRAWNPAVNGGEDVWLALRQHPVDAQVTPEPVTMVLLGTGLVGVGGAALRRRRRNGSDHVD